jgi:hypothetical protein
MQSQQNRSSRNAFTSGNLDRLSNLRHEPDFVQQALHAPTSLFLPYHQLRPLLRSDSKPSNSSPESKRTSAASSTTLHPCWVSYDVLQRLMTDRFQLASEPTVVPSSGRHVTPNQLQQQQQQEQEQQQQHDESASSTAHQIDWVLLGASTLTNEFLFAVDVTDMLQATDGRSALPDDTVVVVPPSSVDVSPLEQRFIDATRISRQSQHDINARFLDLRASMLSLSHQDVSIVGQVCCPIIGTLVNTSTDNHSLCRGEAYWRGMLNNATVASADHRYSKQMAGMHARTHRCISPFSAVTTTRTRTTTTTTKTTRTHCLFERSHTEPNEFALKHRARAVRFASTFHEPKIRW